MGGEVDEGEVRRQIRIGGKRWEGRAINITTTILLPWIESP